MPNSKRDKRVYLTKTRKKGLSFKQKIIEDVRHCLSYYDCVYIFRYHNIRNNHLKVIRNELIKSRLFFGKNALVKVALGRSKEDEVADNVHKLSRCMKGTCGLYFTNRKKHDVVDWFNNFSVTDFARSGCKVNTTVELKEGPLEQFTHSLEPYVRQLGLPTKLDKGIVTLIKDHVVCKEGDVLTPEQGKLLQLLGHKLETFRLELVAMWSKPGNFEKLSSKDEEDEDEEEGDAEMEDGDDD